MTLHRPDAYFLYPSKALKKSGQRLSLVLMLLLGWHSMAIAAVTVKIDPNPVQVNDSFHLILTSDDAQARGLPNLTPLQKEFTILGTQRSISVNMINGQTTSISQWIILLRPNKTGILAIPAITIGQQQTQPTTVTVTDASTEKTNPSHNTDNEDVLLKADASEKNPYINQQVLYTVKLYSSKQLINAEYHPPHVEDALLIPLGEGRHYEADLNQHRYAVEEQQYAIFPQKSGALTINPPTFNAAIYDEFPGRVNVSAKATTLNVKPAPATPPNQPWLPAKQITLTESFDQPLKSFNEGDTLTRTISLKAVAMPAQLLPTLPIGTNGQFSVYPERPELKNTISANELTGTTTLKVTYLLNHSGKINLPELKLTWFNTNTGKAETTALPPHPLTVKANVANNTVSSPQNTVPSTHGPTKPVNDAMSTNARSYALFYALAAGFGLAWILFIFIGWIRQHAFFAHKNQSHLAIRRLQQACKKNRPNQAHAAILLWARTQWPEIIILNLQDIARLTRDNNLKKQLTVLTQFLYKPSSQQHWQGNALWRAFNEYRQNKSQPSNPRQDLPPINPL